MSSEFSRCNDEVTELAWENGELALHGLQTKHQAWSEPLPDIFDSIFQHQEFQNICDLQSLSASRKWSENSFSAHIIETSRSMGDEKRDGRHKEKVNLIQPDEEFESMEREKKRARSELEKRVVKECKSTENHDDMSKGESIRSQSSTRRHSRSSDIHNQSERRRRERINQKMRALQKLVPNASKTDKVSMLDEVIQYLKNLQAQVQIMTNARRMHQVAIPLTIQQQLQQQKKQLQMLLLARMGAGMLDFNSLVHNLNPLAALPSLPPLGGAPSLPPLFQPLGGASTSFIAPPFVGMLPVTPPPASASSSIHSSTPDLSNVYNTLLAQAQQSMNMDLLSRMADIYQQQEAKQTSTKTVSNNNNTAFRK